MSDRRNRYTDNSDKPWSDLQTKIDTLSWVKTAKMVLPNLPKGDFKKHIEEEIDAIVSFDASPLRERTKRLQETETSLTELRRQCEGLRHLAKFKPDDISRLRQALMETIDCLHDLDKPIHLVSPTKS